MKSSLVRLLSVGAIVIVGMVAGVSADHSWGPPYHWARTANPLTLKVGDNVSSIWKTPLAIAISDWNASSVLNLAADAGGARSKNCRPTAGRVEVCSGSYGNNGWLGIAQIWVTGGEHITQATTRLNDYYFAMQAYNTLAWRQLVMCQEIGHNFGLDHQDENFNNVNLGTCMDYTNNPTSNQHPDGHDYEELETIYAHLDGFTTAGATALRSPMPPAMGQIDFDTPAQWGELVRSVGGGRVQEYMLDFGRGNRVITHVFWADPDGDGRRR
jgi:hypothetical protein